MTGVVLSINLVASMKFRNMAWKSLYQLSLILMLLLVLSVGAGALMFFEGGSLSVSQGGAGCYVYDSMLIGFNCKGFGGSSLLSVWLNWPLWLYYGPVFSFSSFKALVVAVVAWLPIILFLVSLYLRHRHKH